MSTEALGPTLTPTIMYNNARQAIRWLTDVLGFKSVAVFESPDGNVVFAQLVWRTGVVFISARPRDDNPWANVGIASIALSAEDVETVDSYYQRAIVVGAEIVRPVHDAKTPLFPKGSHQFDLRDPEGNLWTVGTYQPLLSVSE